MPKIPSLIALIVVVIQVVLLPGLEGKVAPKGAAEDALAALQEVAETRLTELTALVNQLKDDLNDATDQNSANVNQLVNDRIQAVVSKIQVLRNNTEPMGVDTSICDENADKFIEQLTEKALDQLAFCTSLAEGENGDVLSEALNEAQVSHDSFVNCGENAVTICAGTADADECSGPVADLVNSFAAELPLAFDVYQANVQNIAAVTRNPCTDLLLGSVSAYAANIMRNTAICYNTAVITSDNEPIC